MEISGQGEGKKAYPPAAWKKSGGSLAARNKLVDQYRPKLEQAAKKVVNNEVEAVKGALANDRSGFLKWLDDYEKRLPAVVQQKFAVVLSQYANELKTAALEDVDADSVEDFAGFIEKYLKVYADRWTQSSIGQLKALITVFDGVEADQAIEKRLGQWEARRPQKAANDESVRASNAVARYVWAAAGVTNLIWKTQGSKTCPYCHQLNGKKVGITEPFLKRDETITASDGSGMKIFGKKLHAPIHQGCKCTIIPG
jgi:enoyl reductase-like protein